MHICANIYIYFLVSILLTIIFSNSVKLHVNILKDNLFSDVLYL